MKIKELLQEGEVLLHAISDSPLLDAQVLLMNVLGVDKIYLMIHFNELVSEEKIRIYRQLLECRSNYTPIAYLINKKAFYGRDFFVKEGVLIPRPDTEILVERVLERLDSKESISGIEIGCGSGAISITLLLEKINLSMIATDIESIPIEVTSRNASLYQVNTRLDLIKTSLFEEILYQKVDFIVSNPPYISRDDIGELMRDVVEYEPETALFAEENGLYFYRKILEDGVKYLKEDGFFAFEIGCNQADEVTELCYKHGFKKVEVYQDLYGLDRVVVAFS